MHYYQHHIGDFIRDTSRLSDAHCMTYLRMVWHYYDTEQPLPNNVEVIAFKVGADAQVVHMILQAYFKQDGEVWRHTRCDTEIAEYKAICNRNKTNGKAGGRPKKTQSVSSGLPVAGVPEASGNPNQYPVSSNQGESASKPARPAKPSHPCPEDVAPETWADWLTLRKAKKAPVTDTVVTRARQEAVLANMDLDAFLQVWCMRGSQGLQADWLQPQERATASRRVSYAQEAADVARTTVPGRQGIDPTLAAMNRDAQQAAPPPAEVRAKIQQMLGRKGNEQ